MVKTKVLDLELAEIGWWGFNFPWCTGYSPKRHQRGLDLIIHKDTNNYCPHRLRLILLFDIEENMHNKHLGITATRQAESIDGLSP